MQHLGMGQAINQALREEMTQNPGVFIAGEGVGVSIHENPMLPTTGLLQDFGAGRVKDTPVSEAAIDSFSKNKDYQKVIAQLDKYWEKLFSDPITIQAAGKTVTIQPQRTNNIMERFFRDLKRGHRRKTGNHSMSKTLQAMLSDTPLVKNLQNPAYLDILLDGQPNLETLFSNIDKRTAYSELENQLKSPERVPAKFKKLIANQAFPQVISNMLVLSSAG